MKARLKILLSFHCSFRYPGTNMASCVFVLDLKGKVREARWSLHAHAGCMALPENNYNILR